MASVNVSVAIAVVANLVNRVTSRKASKEQVQRAFIMLQPKRTKFRKAFKGRIHGASKGGFSLSFGQFGLKAMEPERITARQIEAARRAMTRHMKRAGRVWIRIFPDVPVSKANRSSNG